MIRNNSERNIRPHSIASQHLNKYFDYNDQERMKLYQNKSAKHEVIETATRQDFVQLK